MIIEIVVYNIASAIQAEKGGADRIELCDNPGEGGTTPSAGIIEIIKQALNIPVFVMVRPRGGDFCYSAHEFESMKKDIILCKKLGIPGVVLGILNTNGNLDKERCRELIQLAKPMQVTCHRAIDMSRDPFQTLEDCIDVGFDRILTSGHHAKAEQGIDVLSSLVQKSKNRISIMAGSGISEQNIHRIVAETGVQEIHFSALTYQKSRMEYRNEKIVGMGSAGGGEFMLRSADHELISRMRQLAESANTSLKN